MMLISTPALCQDAPQAAPAEGAAAGASSGSEPLTPAARQRIARVNGLSTSYSQNSNKHTTSFGAEARTHLVVDGDTLWGISEVYMNDPFMWPALWSYNPQVTNPHWIYPGDVIYLEPYKAELVENVPIPEEKPLVEIHAAKGRGVIAVPGIYLSEMPETKGHILYSDQEKHMLTFGDMVQVDWVDAEMRNKVSKGQRFVIFSEGTPVKDEDGEPMAYKLIRVGTMELVDVQTESLSTGRIIKAFREIERGDIIIPDMDLNFNMTRTPNGQNLQGRIIDTIEKNSQLGEQLYVIINRGREDGVQVGNSFAIFEQREGLARLPYAEEKEDEDKDDEEKDPRDGEITREGEHNWVLGRETRAPEFPPRKDLSEIYGDREYTTADLPARKIGEVLIINTQDKFSTGIIMDNCREVEINKRVVMIKGQ